MFATAAIHTKNLERHRMPGVCISLIGFSLIFTGVMIMGINSTLKNSTGNAVQVAGPTCLTIGGLMVIGGFTAQYLLHKRYKEKLRRLKASRERAKKSIAVISGASGRAARYLPDAGADGREENIEVSVPSTSHGRIMPSITVETILEEEEYYARQRLDINRLQREDNGDNQFLNFSGQSFSFDDSSDDEYAPPSQTRTEAVIEHRKQSDDNSSSKESVPSAGKSKTPSGPSIKESLDGESDLDTTITRSTEIVHISTPRPAVAASKDLRGEKRSEIDDNDSSDEDKNNKHAESSNSSSQSNVDQSPVRSGTKSSSGGKGNNRDVGSGSSDSSPSQSSLDSIVSERAAPISGSIPDYGRSRSYTENNERARSWSDDNRSRTRTMSRALSARQRRHGAVNGGLHDNASRSQSNGTFLKPATPSGLLTTSWIASDADDSQSFVESLSRSSSFTRHDLPSIERPGQFPENDSPADPASLADSPQHAESPPLADSWSLADSQEKIPTEVLPTEQSVNNHIDHSHDDKNRFQFAELNGARITDGRESGSTSPSDVSKCSTPKHINGRMNEERTHRVNKPDPDWSGNGDVIAADMTRPRKSKGKMTKHNKCKNPRADYEDYVVNDYTP